MNESKQEKNSGLRSAESEGFFAGGVKRQLQSCGTIYCRADSGTQHGVGGGVGGGRGQQNQARPGALRLVNMLKTSLRTAQRYTFKWSEEWAREDAAHTVLSKPMREQPPTTARFFTLSPSPAS